MKVAAWVLVAVAAGLYICGSIVDVDLWWHIAVGRWILHRGALPAVDYWNYYSSGEAWRAYSWSSEIVYAWVDGAFGLEGLLVLKALLAVSLSLAFCFSFSLIARDYAVGSMLGVVCSAACYAHFVLRPQTLTWLLFALALAVGEGVRRHGVRSKYLLMFAGIFAVWANTHLSAIVGIGYLSIWVGRYERASFSLKPGLMVVLAAFIGTLLTPYFGGEWLTLLGKLTHPLTHRNIVEFRAATFADYSAAFLIILMIALLRLVHERPRALELPVIVVGCLLAYGGLAVLKFLPFGYIALCGLISRYWGEVGGALSSGSEPGMGEALHKLRALLLRVPPSVFALIALLVVAQKSVELSKEIVRPGAFPTSAVSFIEERGLGELVSNVFGDGGYLIYRFSNPDGTPTHKVVLDGRTNVNSPEVVEAYQEALYGRADWERYLEFGSKVVLWRSKWPLASILSEDPRWCRVYFDGGVSSGWSVFVHRDRISDVRDVEPRLCEQGENGSA